MMFIERCARAWAERDAAKKGEGWGEWALKNKGADDLIKWLIKVSNG